MTTTVAAEPMTVVVGLEDNNTISRFPCVVPKEHRAPDCWGCVEKTNVPLTPVLVNPDGTSAGDVCWLCLPHISPVLNLVHDVFDRMAETDTGLWHQHHILNVAERLLDRPDEHRHVYATSDDMRTLTGLMLLARTRGHWVSSTHPPYVVEAVQKGYVIGRHGTDGGGTWWEPCALCRTHGIAGCPPIGDPHDPDDSF